MPGVFGTFVAEIDRHLGTPIFGTAGSALAVVAAGQMARRYGLPFRPVGRSRLVPRPTCGPRRGP